MARPQTDRAVFILPVVSCYNGGMAEARDWPLDALRGAIMIVMALDHANDLSQANIPHRKCGRVCRVTSMQYHL